MNETLRALVVDDDPTNLIILTRFLNFLGISCITVSNAAAALDKFQNERDFDLVLTDNQMPEKTGWVLIQEILAINPSFPVILTTSAVSDGRWIESGTKAGRIRLPDDMAFLPRPFSPDALKQIIEEATGIKLQEKEIPQVVRVMPPKDNTKGITDLPNQR